VFVALEPAVDARLVESDALHVEDGFGARVGFAAVADDFVEVVALLSFQNDNKCLGKIATQCGNSLIQICLESMFPKAPDTDSFGF
jgi:hypothetical protein